MVCCLGVAMVSELLDGGGPGCFRFLEDLGSCLAAAEASECCMDRCRCNEDGGER